MKNDKLKKRSYNVNFIMGDGCGYRFFFKIDWKVGVFINSIKKNMGYDNNW